MVLRLLPLALLLGATSIAAQVPARAPTRAATADTAAQLLGNAGWFGFRQLLRGDTLTVLEVASGSPAERAGLRPGDRILTIDGRTVNERHLNVWPATVGSHRKLTVVRGSETLSLSMVAEVPPRGTSMPSRSTPMDPDTVAREARLLRGEIAQRATRAATLAPTVADSMATSDMARTNRRLRTLLMDSALEARARSTDPLIIVDGVLMTNVDSLRGGGQALVTDPELYARLQRTLSETDAVVAKLARFTSGSNAISGAEFEELNPGLADYFGGVSEGVFVLRVAETTPAATAGLRPGDIVQDVNGQWITTVNELRSAVSEASGTIVLRVLRKGRPATITLRKE